MAKVSVSNYQTNNKLEDGIEINTVKNIWTKYEIATDDPNITITVNGREVSVANDGNNQLRDDDIVCITKHHHNSGK